MEKDRHKRKFLDFILKPISKIDSPQILEFGISEIGMSTSIFLDLCKKNNGKLISVDTNKNSRSFQDINWKFINTRDDNFDVIEKYIDNINDLPNGAIYFTGYNQTREIIFYGYVTPDTESKLIDALYFLNKKLTII